MNYQRKKSTCGIKSGALSISNAVIILVLLLVVPSQLVACSNAPGAEAVDRTAVAAATMPVTEEPAVTATATAFSSPTASPTPTVTPSQTPTAEPTETPTPTPTPSITPTPTPDPVAEYLALVWTFLEGSNTIKNIIFEEPEVSDETLATYEALLETVTQIGEALLDDEDMLPALRPLIVETVEVCSRANGAWMAVARTANESGKTVASSVISTDEYFENLSAVDACATVLTPQLIEAIRGD